jgi:hypothetical protein
LYMIESLRGLPNLFSFSPMFFMRGDSLILNVTCTDKQSMFVYHIDFEVGPPKPKRALTSWYTLSIFKVISLSRFIELLKQIPPGKEEIPDKLLKQLDIAATGLIINQAGQYDLSEEERKEYEAYDDSPEVYDKGGRWGLLDRWPLHLGDLAVFVARETNDWYLEISSESNPYMTLMRGSKRKILAEADRLNEFRKIEGEEAFEDEVMRMVDRHLKLEEDEYVRSR